MNAQPPEYIVLTESEHIHLVCIRYGGGKPWLRVVAVFPSKDRAESYAEVENQFTVEDESSPPCWPDDLQYDDHPTADEPVSVLSDLVRRAEDRAEIEIATERLAEIEAHPETLVPLETVKAEIEKPASKGITDSDDRDKRIGAMWLNGAPVAEIASAFNISEQRVYQIRKELGLPSRAPAPAKKPEKAPAKPAPKPAPAPTVKSNGAGQPEYTRAGVTICLGEGNEKITVGENSVPLTIGQSRLCACLLRAAPHPVGLQYIGSNVFGNRLSQDDASMRLKSMVGSLNGGILAPLGLDVREIKGIGYALAGVTE